MKKKILLLEPQKIIAESVQKLLSDYEIIPTKSASDALALANDNSLSAVVVELSLAGHSGFEFLYEFRSYVDWQDIPIIIYTSVDLNSEVVESRSWRALKISDYIYKPTESLASLRDSIEKALSDS